MPDVLGGLPVYIDTRGGVKMMNPINVTQMLIIEERRALEAERDAAIARMMDENAPARANGLASLGRLMRALGQRLERLDAPHAAMAKQR
jgi:hypothetical protein